MGSLFSKEEPDSNLKQNIPPPPLKKQEFSEFEKNILRLHNLAREKNGLEPLQWDKSLQQRAADWNQFLAQQDGGTALCSNMRHPGTDAEGSEEEIGKFLPNGNGQNLYNVSLTGATFEGAKPADAVRKWYDECNIWKMPAEGQDVPDRFLEIGHMTQLLWKDTSKVGCSSIGCRTKGSDTVNGEIITCNYDKGNIGGQFQTKIPKNIKCDKSNDWIH